MSTKKLVSFNNAQKREILKILDAVLPGGLHELPQEFWVSENRFRVVRELHEQLCDWEESRD